MAQKTVQEQIAALDAELQSRFERIEAERGNACAHADQAGYVRGKLEMAMHDMARLRAEVRRLERELSAEAAYGDLDPGESVAYTVTLDEAPCVIDCNRDGRVCCAYIGGAWVDSAYFSDKAHQSWGRQIAELVDVMREAA